MTPGPLVELWRWRLDPTPATLEVGWAMLSEDERARAEKFHFPLHRRRFIAAHGRLRAILAGCLDVDPAGLRFVLNAEGKPALDGTGAALHFNLSHSHEMAILGLTTGGPLGVDIEQVRPVSEDLAAHHFAPAEVARLRMLPVDRQLEAFFLCWTRKEAYIKAVGRGLAIPLDSFEVSLTPGEPAALIGVAGAPDEAQAWKFAHLLPAPGYVGALAMRHRGWTGGQWVGDDHGAVR